MQVAPAAVVVLAAKGINCDGDDSHLDWVR